MMGSPEDLAGLYSDFARVGQTPAALVIDFGVLLSSADRDLMEEWAQKGTYPALPIARVRLPLDVAEGLVRAIQDQLEKARAHEVFKPAPVDAKPTEKGD